MIRCRLQRYVSAMNLYPCRLYYIATGEMLATCNFCCHFETMVNCLCSRRTAAGFGHQETPPPISDTLRRIFRTTRISAVPGSFPLQRALAADADV